MEHLLQEIARKLDALDEASLMALWNKYADIVLRFEPTKRWEEAALIFGLIQAKHWKNQLFNQRLSDSLTPPKPQLDVRIPLFFSNTSKDRTKEDSTDKPQTEHHAKILQFRKQKTD